jgi:hypothetical protein
MGRSEKRLGVSPRRIWLLPQQLSNNTRNL